MSENIINISNLQVKFGETVILDLSKSIQINEGDIVGIIGENGAGKSTLIKSIIGEVEYTGKITCNFLKDKLGIQFQNNSYNKLMKVFELIQIVTKKSKFDDELLTLIKEFELDSLLKKRIGKLSGGELQRVTLFLVLYLKPDIMIFDELTTGLDFQKRQKLLKIVRNYSENRTVLNITHYFEELQDWANKILILQKGNMVFFGTIEDLKNKYYHYSIIKIKKNQVNLIKKDIEDLVEIDEETIALVVGDGSQQEKIIKICLDNHVFYEVVPCSIYTMYILAIKKGESKLKKNINEDSVSDKICDNYKLHGIKIGAVDERGKPLSGIQFVLKMSNQNKSKKIITDENGRCLLDSLSEGEYRIAELQDGQIKFEYTFDLPYNGQKNVFRKDIILSISFEDKLVSITVIHIKNFYQETELKNENLFKLNLRDEKILDLLNITLTGVIIISYLKLSYLRENKFYKGKKRKK